jgi:hypothetical protein
MPLTYPSLSVYRASYYNEEEPDYPGGKNVYQDGGADYLSLADTPIRRWTISYAKSGLLAAEAAVFSTLASSSRYNRREGSLIGFEFTPRGESLLSDVHFDEGGFEIRRGNKAHIYIVEVKLIKRP